MSADQDAMIAALGDIEADAQHLAASRARFLNVYQKVYRAAYSHPHANQQFLLEQTVGMARLDGLLVQRLRALGLGPVLDVARTDGTVADLSALTSKIRASVP